MTDVHASNGPSIYEEVPGQGTSITLEEITPAKIREHWQASSRDLRHERNQAALNDQFIRNKHWLHMNAGTNRLEELPRNPERVRATVAKIGPDSHRVIGKLTSRPLTFEVPVETPDDQAAQASRVGEAALHQTASKQNWEDLRYDHASITWASAVGGVCVEWDNSVGDPIGMNQQGQLIRTGDVKLTVVHLNEIACEPGTRDIEHGYWWIRAQALAPADVQRHYQLPKIPAADSRSVTGVWRAADHDRGVDTPMTMVYTYYERPHGQSQGRVVTCVGDDIVEQTAWPFPFTDRLNIACAVVWPIHGQWLGHTPVTDAVPIQVAMNASWSSIIEHMKQAGNARLFIPDGAVDDIEDLSDMPGEAVNYRAINGERPYFSTPPSMPDWWIRQPAMLGEAMDDALGQHDVSRGVAPAGIESGIALATLSENDDTPVGRFGKNLAGMWGRVASMVLEVYSQRVMETREATVIAPGSKIPEVVKWNGDSLQGHTHAIVPVDSVMPRGRNAQMAYAFQLHDRGLIQDNVQLARIADLPEQQMLLEAISPDTARAMRENAHLSSGSPRTVDGIDDHANHIALHRDFMRSQRYENLDQQSQLIFRLHVAAHEQYAAFQAAQMAQAASVSPMAAALPSESVNQMDQGALEQAALLSQMAPSAATAMAPGQGPDMSMMQSMSSGPPAAGGPPVAGGSDQLSDAQAEQQMSQQQLREGPP